MEESRNDTPEQENTPKFRGLYRYVKISVKALDWIIVACIAVILIVFALEMRSPGFTVTFDSRGGSDVPAQTEVMYGDYVVEPEPPTREGYNFTGWYSDENCQYQWDFDTMQVSQSITLYAGWIAK